LFHRETPNIRRKGGEGFSRERTLKGWWKKKILFRGLWERFDTPRSCWDKKKGVWLTGHLKPAVKTGGF